MKITREQATIAATAARVRRELRGALQAFSLRAPDGQAATLAAILGKQDRAEVAREAHWQIETRRAKKRQKPVYQPTIHQRLSSLREQHLSAAAGRALRTGDGVVIHLTTNPSEVDAYYTSECLGRYSSRCTYLQYTHHLHITAPATWRTRVEKAGLATAGGMLTLDAQPCDCSAPGVRLYAAKWIEQAAGYNCRVIDGYLAIDESGESHHAAKPELAVRGLARKHSISPERRREIAAKAQVGRLRNLAARNDFEVCIEHARKVGACEYGIRSWCHRAGIDPERGCIPAAEAIAAYFENPVSEARAAILYAARHA